MQDKRREAEKVEISGTICSCLVGGSLVHCIESFLVKIMCARGILGAGARKFKIFNGLGIGSGGKFKWLIKEIEFPLPLN